MVVVVVLKKRKRVSGSMTRVHAEAYSIDRSRSAEGDVVAVVEGSGGRGCCEAATAAARCKLVLGLLVLMVLIDRSFRNKQSHFL